MGAKRITCQATSLERPYDQPVDGQPIDITREYGRKPARAWWSPGAGPWDEATIYLGQLADRRWYTTTTERTVNPNAWAWPKRERAEEHVAELLAQRDDWQHTPAYFDGGGQPHGELGPWRKEGRRWVLDD